MRRLLLLIAFALLTTITAACADKQEAAAAPSVPPVEITPTAPAEVTPAVIAEAGPTAVQQEEEDEPKNSSDDMVVMREKMFIAQYNDIMFNPKDYEGKTIKVEGMYQQFVGTTSGIVYHYVSRNSPGCCGDDGSVGFEFLYNGEVPAIDDWIEVIGTLKYVEQGGVKFLVISANELNVKAERGAEFVYN